MKTIIASLLMLLIGQANAQVVTVQSTNAVEDAIERPVPQLSVLSGFAEVLPDDFQSLVLLRKKVVVKQRGLEEELRRLQDEQSYLPPSIEDIKANIKSIEIRKKQDETALKSLEAKGDLSEEERHQVDYLNSYIADSEYQISRAQSDIVRFNELNRNINRINNDLVTVNDYLAPIEQKIADLLNLEEERNSFRTWISISFCVLVAIVIIGFYVIAIKKEEIAESIFSGEKGIQFVTIFLIVISIILFGIMGVLESKELSALLGGLSGYILGRVGGQPIQRPAPPVDGKTA